MESERISKESLSRVNLGKRSYQASTFKDMRPAHLAQAKLIEAMSGYDSSLSFVLQKKSDHNILQRVRFNQPRTGVLKEKCYAYSLFNALDRTGAMPAGMTQIQADAWILANESNTMGGGPKQVSDKLTADGTIAANSTYIQMANKQKFRLAVRYGLSHNLPVVIGVKAGSTNHWVYATGTIATPKTIVAEDQQNSDFGILHFTLRQSGNWRARGQSARGHINYTINHVSIGTQTQVQRDSIYAHYY